MITTRSVFAALPVADLATAVTWWSTVVGREPDKRPAPHIAEFYVDDSRDPRRGTLQLITDTERAGCGLATLNVAALGPLLDDLASHDITAVDGITDIGPVLVAIVTDADGNLVNLVQAPE